MDSVNVGVQTEHDVSFVDAILNDLKIPAHFVHHTKGLEAVIIAKRDWLCQILEANEIPDINDEGLNSSEIKLNLASGSDFASGEFIKCKVRQFNSDIYKLALCPTFSSGKHYLCHGDVFDAICTDNCIALWQNICMKFSDAYMPLKIHDVLMSASSSKCGTQMQDFHPEELYHILSPSSCIQLYGVFDKGDKVFILKEFVSHSVQDVLMYSPALLISSGSAKLFILYQILKLFDILHQTFPLLCLSTFSWKDVALNSRLWTQADIFCSQEVLVQLYEIERSFKEGHFPDSQLCTSLEKEPIDGVVSKWICGKITNFDYLMYLNNLAGRRSGDPHHHPILPWVSDLSQAHGGWRDLSKSKYRDVEVVISSTTSASTPITSASTNKKRENHC